MNATRTISGERIRQARHAKGMTQQALAVAAGVSERNIVRWENDKNTPRPDHVAAIARATNQGIEFFYSDAEQEAAPPGDPFHGPAGAPARGRKSGRAPARKPGELAA